MTTRGGHVGGWNSGGKGFSVFRTVPRARHSSADVHPRETQARLPTAASFVTAQIAHPVSIQRLNSRTKCRVCAPVACQRQGRE